MMWACLALAAVLSCSLPSEALLVPVDLGSIPVTHMSESRVTLAEVGRWTPAPPHASFTTVEANAKKNADSWNLALVGDIPYDLSVFPDDVPVFMYFALDYNAIRVDADVEIMAFQALTGSTTPTPVAGGIGPGTITTVGTGSFAAGSPTAGREWGGLTIGGIKGTGTGSIGARFRLRAPNTKGQDTTLTSITSATIRAFAQPNVLVTDVTPNVQVGPTSGSFISVGGTHFIAGLGQPRVQLRGLKTFTLNCSISTFNSITCPQFTIADAGSYSVHVSIDGGASYTPGGTTTYRIDPQGTTGTSGVSTGMFIFGLCARVCSFMFFVDARPNSCGLQALTRPVSPPRVIPQPGQLVTLSLSW
jgi:hypothetical protein